VANPACTVQDGAGAPASTTNGVTVTAGDTITIALVSVAGVQSWTIACVGTDELQAAATINAGLTINGVSKTATFTMPAAAALGFRSTVVDANGVSTSTQLGVYSLANGLRVGFVGETTEGNAAFGTAATVNAKIRQAAGGSTSRNVPAVEKTANYTLMTSDYLVTFTGSTSGQTLTLPGAPAAGDPYSVSNESTVPVTIAGNGNTIRGGATFVLQPGSALNVTKSTSAIWTTT
jgi:hypothetical protein